MRYNPRYVIVASLPDGSMRRRGFRAPTLASAFVEAQQLWPELVSYAVESIEYFDANIEPGPLPNANGGAL